MAKIKITINTVFGSVLWESEKDTIKEAVLEKFARDADLCGANLENLPQDWINQCSRDILFILGCLKTEVPALRKMLIEGKVDGSQYEGECACLIGSLANADGGLEKVCQAIPFYERGTHNYGEQWFLNIHKGDTPETNAFSKHAVALCDMVLAQH
jgi:hypothetical protein